MSGECDECSEHTLDCKDHEKYELSNAQLKDATYEYIEKKDMTLIKLLELIKIFVEYGLNLNQGAESTISYVMTRRLFEEEKIKKIKNKL